MKTRITILTAALFAAFISTTYAGPGPGGGWPGGFPTHVTTKEMAMKCCLPGQKVALACKDCKTVNEKGGEDKKGILSWFQPDSKHDCSGCGGKITVTTTGGGKGPTLSEYKHTCSKCGPESAFTCATHKG